MGGPNFIQRKLAEKLVGNIDKEDFKGMLKEQWRPHLSRNSDPQDEVRKSRNRIKSSGYSGVFKKLGLTDEDILEIVTSIIEEKKALPR